MEKLEEGITFDESRWDTDFFGVTSAKAILHRPLLLSEWNKLKSKFKNYQFISIVNRNSDPTNARLIGTETLAFLVDLNIQFEKKVTTASEMPQGITIHRALQRNDQIIDIADFQFSKFTEDSKLEKRGGSKVYREWLINAFDKPDKYFALSKNECGDINGFLLFSYSNDGCVIELISVSKKEFKSGIGTKLFKSVEYKALQDRCRSIKVGTQVRNLGAINFYQKVGCKQVESHQVYHLWNS